MIDWTGLRLTALERAKVQDLDEHRRAFLARRSIAKNKKPVWNELFDAVVAQLPPREDRDLEAALFPGFKGDNLRTAISRACRLTGAPHFSPHGLRKRRGSLLSKQGYSLAEVAERLGDTKVVTAEHYLYALGRLHLGGLRGTAQGRRSELRSRPSLPGRVRAPSGIGRDCQPREMDGHGGGVGLDRRGGR
jgi:integrase